MDIQQIASHCKKAAIFMSALSGAIKNKALQNIINELKANTNQISEANQKDLESAQKKFLEAPLLKRLKFDSSKLFETNDGIASLIQLEDPVKNIAGN